MKINEIDHCALTVINLERSFDWFKDLFDLEIIHKWQTTWMIGKGEIKLGLFQRPDGKPIEELDSKIGFQHVAFLTDCKGFIDIQVQLQTQGVEFEGPEDTGIAYSIFIKDPDGNQFEITTYYQPVDGTETLPIDVLSESQCCDRVKVQS
jgi:catechol 2,3-dioxygenase-like lactoylglutathione lyase family enzyme